MTVANAQNTAVETDVWTYLGVADAKIVGIQHYPGTVGDDETVTFMRDPANPHDENAVQVLNELDELVGYLPRTAAEYLAPLLDSGDLEVLGSVASGSSQWIWYKPLKLFIHAKLSQADAVCSALGNAGLDLQHSGASAEQLLEDAVADLHLS